MSYDQPVPITDEAIESWRLCLDHNPQPQLGQFNWPWVLGLALDEIERLRLDARLAELAALGHRAGDTG